MLGLPHDGLWRFLRARAVVRLVYVISEPEFSRFMSFVSSGVRNDVTSAYIFVERANLHPFCLALVLGAMLPYIRCRSNTSVPNVFKFGTSVGHNEDAVPWNAANTAPKRRSKR